MTFFVSHYIFYQLFLGISVHDMQETFSWNLDNTLMQVKEITCLLPVSVQRVAVHSGYRVNWLAPSIIQGTSGEHMDWHYHKLTPNHHVLSSSEMFCMTIRFVLRKNSHHTTYASLFSTTPWLDSTSFCYRNMMITLPMTVLCLPVVPKFGHHSSFIAWRSQAISSHNTDNKDVDIWYLGSIAVFKMADQIPRESLVILGLGIRIVL